MQVSETFYYYYFYNAMKVLRDKCVFKASYTICLACYIPQEGQSDKNSGGN